MTSSAPSGFIPRADIVREFSKTKQRPVGNIQAVSNVSVGKYSTLATTRVKQESGSKNPKTIHKPKLRTCPTEDGFDEYPLSPHHDLPLWPYTFPMTRIRTAIIGCTGTSLAVLRENSSFPPMPPARNRRRNSAGTAMTEDSMTHSRSWPMNAPYIWRTASCTIIRLGISVARSDSRRATTRSRSPGCLSPHHGGGGIWRTSTLELNSLTR